MASEKEVRGVNIGTEDLANAIVSATEQISGQMRRVPYGQQSLVTPFNPTGKANRKLAKTFYQAGFRINVKTVTDEEIALLHQIKPGSYIDNLVKVVEHVGPEGSEVNILYSNKTADQRMALGSRIGSGRGKTGFERMLNLILDEYKEQQEAQKAARKREIEEALS